MDARTGDDQLRLSAAAVLSTWLQSTYGTSGWLETPLGGWEPRIFEPDMSEDVPDDLEGWPPYSWAPLGHWLPWIAKIKVDASLREEERRMLLLNALAVLQGRLGGMESIERVVADAEVEMRSARASGAVDEFVPMLVDPPTPWASMDEWLRFLRSMKECEPSHIQEYSLAQACQVVLKKVAMRRAAELDPELVDHFWLMA